jgi:sucrose-6-phosphate hydrolase SacC (GH32 family)
VTLAPPGRDAPDHASARIADLDGDAFEIRVAVDRAQAERKRFGVRLFADGGDAGLLVLLRPETGTLCVGDTEAPFAVADLPAGEDLELSIFVDKYLVEVFANGRQAALSVFTGYRDSGSQLRGYVFGRADKVAPTTFRSVDIWRLKPTNQGFLEARAKPIWRPDTR